MVNTSNLWQWGRGTARGGPLPRQPLQAGGFKALKGSTPLLGVGSIQGSSSSVAQYCSRLLGGLAPPNLGVLICKWGALPRCLLPEVFQGPKRMVLLQRRVQTSGKGRGKGRC